MTPEQFRLCLLAVAHALTELANSNSSGPGPGARSREEDRWLTVPEAAAILGVTTRWVYGHAADLPFTVRPSPGKLRFSESGLRGWMAERWAMERRS